MLETKPIDFWEQAKRDAPHLWDPENMLSFEDFLFKYEEDLYIMYMESGAYYDTDREVFDEIQFDDYEHGRGIWLNKRKETVT